MVMFIGTKYSRHGTDIQTTFFFSMKDPRKERVGKWIRYALPQTLTRFEVQGVSGERKETNGGQEGDVVEIKYTTR
jgi:hypothetical protein